ncbi:hypothetical protein [Clostridium sp. VAP51]|uniref:hypothetical protein n=1 Tax=Clostridium sp. VAP51 TaxID=2949978 RepID=UPI00207ABA24|nr:hypothetical protein [Clostridium sp. VAP51]
MDKKLNDSMDKKITECLNKKSDEISAPENMFFKIRAGILKENKGGLFNMKFKFSKPKIAILVGLLCIATTVTGVAASTNGLSWIGSSSRFNDINKFPATDKVEDTVGFLPKYVETFDGDFEFKSFNFSNQDLKKDDGEVITSTKTADFQYKRSGASSNQHLYLSAQKVEEKYTGSNEENSYNDVVYYNNLKIDYHSFKYKGVPEKYVPTDEELKMVDEGTLQIGYGLDKITEDNMQCVSWYENGIQYSILNSNYDDVDKDQMIEMAKTVINK